MTHVERILKIRGIKDDPHPGKSEKVGGGGKGEIQKRKILAKE